MKALLILMLAMSSGLRAEERPVNYCKDPQKAAEWEKQLADTPEDPLIIKLYALRVGLCKMIDEGKIQLEEAIRIWASNTREESMSAGVKRGGSERLDRGP